MIILFEGPDRCGKSTQITKLQSLLTDKPLHLLHYFALKGFSNSESIKEYSYNLYKSMFDLLKNNYKESHFIIDRAHISEAVYSPLYRNYSGEYVYDLEKNYIGTEFWSQFYLITFIDNIENIIKRDDGLSFTIEPGNISKEINSFIDATQKSNIINKKIINIANKSINIVQEEIKRFLNG